MRHEYSLFFINNSSRKNDVDSFVFQGRYAVHFCSCSQDWPLSTDVGNGNQRFLRRHKYTTVFHGVNIYVLWNLSHFCT